VLRAEPNPDGSMTVTLIDRRSTTKRVRTIPAGPAALDAMEHLCRLWGLAGLTGTVHEEEP
jgi:hypothetical protein